MPVLPSGSWGYTLKCCVEQESWITTLWRWSSYATYSSHPYKERQRLTSANPQRHFAARLSTTLQMPFLLLFFLCFSGRAMLSVGYMYNWDWSLLVLWQQCEWLSNHAYVTRYLGRVTLEHFWLGTGRWQHIVLFPREKYGSRASAEAQPAPSVGRIDYFPIVIN